MRHWLSILIIVAAATPLGCASVLTPAGVSPSPMPLPSTSLLTLDGNSTDLRAVLQGRVALVSLWATWCESCVAELEALDRLQQRAGAGTDAIVVGVAVGEPRQRVAAFTRRRGLVYAQLVDEDFRLADALGEPRVPTTLVVDRSGRVVFRGGALDGASLAAFRTALANPQATSPSSR